MCFVFVRQAKTKCWWWCLYSIYKGNLEFKHQRIKSENVQEWVSNTDERIDDFERFDITCRPTSQFDPSAVIYFLVPRVLA